MRQSQAPPIPTVADLYWPTIEALKALGGSATKQEIDAKVIEAEKLTPEQLQVLEGKGPFSAVGKRLAWARTHLGKIGALSTNGQGLWELTERGRSLAEQDTATVRKEVRRTYRHQRKAKRALDGEQIGAEATELLGEPAPIGGTGPVDSQQWKDDVLERLLAMPPDAFERLCQRLLYAAGFFNVVVTGRGGDGGIDGVGRYRMSLVSFPSSFSPRGTAARLALIDSESSAAQWRAAVTRVYSLPRGHLRLRLNEKLYETEFLRSTLSMAISCAISSSSTSSGFAQ